MKLISGLLIHDTPDGTIAVATGKASTVLNGMIRLSPVAAFLFLTVIPVTQALTIGLQHG